VEVALRGALVAVMVGVLLAGSVAFRVAPVDSADDYRPLIAAVRPLIKPGDAALGTYIWMEGMFTSYAPETTSSLRWYQETYGPDTVEVLMAPIAHRHARIWSLNFMRNPDAPDTLSISWLKRNAAYADRFTSGATSALLFDTRYLAQMGAPDLAPNEAMFWDIIRLNYELSSPKVTPGDTVVVSLTWSALHPVSEHFTIFLHLIAPDGQLVAQHDGDAVNGLAPNFTWETGKPVVDRRALLIPATLASGNYTLVAGMYRESDGSRLTTAAGADGVPIATIRVIR
jgi:hypothetical protein